MEIEYNEMYDILYIKLYDCCDAYDEENIKGILINRDLYTEKIVGYEVWDFMKRIKGKEKIQLK